MSAAGPQGAGRAVEPLPVAPVLARDYSRLVRLFPFAYRREHGAEMLGHLLDGARPGQSRPTSAERRDLLRAAAREWLSLLLGATPALRRDAVAALAVILPVLLVVPATKSVALAVWMTTYPEARGHLLASDPLLVSWGVWFVALVVLLCGADRAARLLGIVATLLTGVSFGLLAWQGDLLVLSYAVGWLPAQVLLVVVLGERARAGDVTVPRRRLVGLCAVAAAGWGILLVGPFQNGSFGRWHPGTGVLAVLGIVAVLALLLHARARHALPLLLGVGAGLWVGRYGVFGSRERPFYGVEPQEFAVLAVVVVAVTLTARWVVDRIGDQAADRRKRSTGDDLTTA
ncbi:hypothetical protein [Oerskovia enterophila]|uniref:hypothetical protein n=1 Tax=Oerskovia enterophila TaxID=43678 RepID=UPI00339740F5